MSGWPIVLQKMLMEILPIPHRQKNSLKKKIRSAVRTDFILSIELIVIVLESVMEQQLVMQILVVSFIALLATVGIYGLVALLVKLDDMGFYLVQYA